MKRLFLICLLMISFICSANAELYSTWDTLELDACASAWLFKRFIDKDAVFKFYPKGELIEEGIPFDTPDADLRRRQGASTFEVIMSEYKIVDPKVIEIGKLIHQLEINYWNGSASLEAESLNQQVQAIIDAEKDSFAALEKVFVFFDEMYERLPSY